MSQQYEQIQQQQHGEQEPQFFRAKTQWGDLPSGRPLVDILRYGRDRGMRDRDIFACIQEACVSETLMVNQLIREMMPFLMPCRTQRAGLVLWGFSARVQGWVVFERLNPAKFTGNDLCAVARHMERYQFVPMGDTFGSCESEGCQFVLDVECETGTCRLCEMGMSMKLEPCGLAEHDESEYPYNQDPVECLRLELARLGADV